MIDTRFRLGKSANFVRGVRHRTLAPDEIAQHRPDRAKAAQLRILAPLTHAQPQVDMAMLAQVLANVGRIRHDRDTDRREQLRRTHP